MKAFRRVLGAVSALSMVAAVMVGASAGPAAATHVTCGSTITQSTTLDSDIGPCPGDGLVVSGSNITLDLNQRRIFAANGPGDNAGIRLLNVSGVTVMNGTVEGFDAGILILNGSGNMVRGMTVRNNINDMIPTPQGTPNPCDLGDGIAIHNADNNSIDGNLVVNNGPFGGITLIEDSDGNQIRGNTVQDHKVLGAPGGGCGNNNQDEGIRIEGPGANNNRVLGNNVSRSNLAGIGVHGHVGCADQGGPPPLDTPTPPNTDNIINGNVVTTTGGTGESDGIKILEQGPFGDIVCAAFRITINGNNSSNNERHGINVPGTSINNTINGNVVMGNLGDGIRLGGPVPWNRFRNIGPQLLERVSPSPRTYTFMTDYRVMPGSGSGDVTARLVPIDIAIPPSATSASNPNPVDTSTSGCSQADYDAAGFRPGDIALIQRGTCTFVSKVALAVQNGASAVIMFNEGQSGRTSATFGSVGAQTIPVLSASYAVGFELYNLARAGTVIMHVVTNTENVTGTTPGAENTTVIGNRGSRNAEHDGHDDNPNCDNNRWANNVFRTVNQACVAANGGSGTVTPTP